MNNVNADVFVGALVKSYNVEKGFKGLLEMSDKQQLGVSLGYDGKLKEYLVNNMGKTVILVGSLSFPKDKMPFITVRATLNGGGLVVKRGRLTRDPELKYSSNGKAYVRFSIAVNRGFGDRKETDFINCTIFGNDYERNPAITLAEKGKKGQEIIIAGRLNTNKGNEKTFFDLIVSEYEFIFSSNLNNDRKNGENNESDDPYTEFSALGAEVNLDDISLVDLEEEEIPF